MKVPDDAGDSAGDGGTDPVGSVAEEATKLFAAFATWAGDQVSGADSSAGSGAQQSVGFVQRAAAHGVNAALSGVADVVNDLFTETPDADAEKAERSDASAGACTCGHAVAQGSGQATAGRAHSSCAYCPVCRVVDAVRHISPEVKEHLSAAASSVVAAVTAFLHTDPPQRDAGQTGAAGTAAPGQSADDVGRNDGE